MKKYIANLLWLVLLVAIIFDSIPRFTNETAIVILQQ